MPVSASATPFPTVRWADRAVTFEPVVEPLPLCEVGAVVVFARAACGFVLGNVPGRGWVTPSGRLEPGETPLEAAIRETREEIGATLENPREIGRYVVTPDVGRRYYVPTFIGTVRAFGAIPPDSESRGARCVPIDELPACYWHWDDLMERMFAFAEKKSGSG